MVRRVVVGSAPVAATRRHHHKPREGQMRDTQQVEWQKAFTHCFLKVDDEVGGKVSRGVSSDNADALGASFDPIAPETVGSTAVVALISSSHIIVANCGDSRAVLYRGKEPMALSIDHKVRHFLMVFSFCL